MSLLQPESDLLKRDPFCCALRIRWLPSHPSRDACATGGPLASARPTAFHGPEIFLEVNGAELHHVRPSLSLSLSRRHTRPPRTSSVPWMPATSWCSRPAPRRVASADDEGPPTGGGAAAADGGAASGPGARLLPHRPLHPVLLLRRPRYRPSAPHSEALASTPSRRVRPALTQGRRAGGWIWTPTTCASSRGSSPVSSSAWYVSSIGFVPAHGTAHVFHSFSFKLNSDKTPFVSHLMLKCYSCRAASDAVAIKDFSTITHRFFRSYSSLSTVDSRYS